MTDSYDIKLKMCQFTHLVDARIGMKRCGPLGKMMTMTTGKDPFWVLPINRCDTQILYMVGAIPKKLKKTSINQTLLCLLSSNFCLCHL